MRISSMWLRPLRFLSFGLLLFTLLPWACTRKTVSFNTAPDQPLVAGLGVDTLTRTVDSLRGKPSLSTARKAGLTKAQERAAKNDERMPSGNPKRRRKTSFWARKLRGLTLSPAPREKTKLSRFSIF